ncbi:hypothetical protein TNCV_2084051 [Trichonephila clavipes]|uniref:Uncharacterized protein n=1 Tax=Trichonephila clavipes TaxID=2585209 RepID=A0A8X6RJN8_TRICX|nr:hypothetical protein TNCV_2084051 [Trichonephila clavipes]
MCHSSSLEVVGGAADYSTCSTIFDQRQAGKENNDSLFICGRNRHGKEASTNKKGDHQFKGTGCLCEEQPSYRPAKRLERSSREGKAEFCSKFSSVAACKLQLSQKTV